VQIITITSEINELLVKCNILEEEQQTFVICHNIRTISDDSKFVCLCLGFKGRWKTKMLSSSLSLI